MAIKVGINGFGRIGKLVFQVIEKSNDFEVVVINDLGDLPTLSHLLKYDSAHGRFDGEVSYDLDKSVLKVNGKEIKVIKEKDLDNIKWSEYGVKVVIESTGVFRKKEQILKHIEKGGAEKVILTVPAKSEDDEELVTVVYGVNDEKIEKKHKIISNASCTTNCLAPIVKILNDKFKIKRAFMSTIHAYTNDQNTADRIHKDLRRARAAAVNIIPTTTGAAKAIGKIIPELKGKIDGMAYRVPVITGSCIDLVAELETAVTKEEINNAIKEATQKSPMSEILEYTEDPIVSTDIIHNPASSIFDAQCTMITDKDENGKGILVKVVSWYDNEWGYSNRVLNILRKITEVNEWK